MFVKKSIRSLYSVSDNLVLLKEIGGERRNDPLSHSQERLHQLFLGAAPVRLTRGAGEQALRKISLFRSGSCLRSDDLIRPHRLVDIPQELSYIGMLAVAALLEEGHHL